MNFTKFRVLQGVFYSKVMASVKIILQDFLRMPQMSI